MAKVQLNEGNMRKWCRLFREGRTNVHDERSGCPSLVTDDSEEKSECKNSVKQAIHTIYELHEHVFGRPESRE
jgi:hypothetical protein